MAILLAGIGGDSEASYVLETAHALLADGIAVCVLLARGVGRRAISSIDHIYDATAQADLELLVSGVAPLFEHVVLCGFSMGAVGVNKYLTSHSAQVPANVRCALSVSGAFTVDFMTWSRYVGVYQRMILPNLLERVLSRHGCEARQRLGEEGFKKLVQSSSYRELHANLYSPLAIGKHHEDFNAWKSVLGGVQERDEGLRVPLLLLSALDEPLHHPDMIGAETHPKNPAITYLLTREGGHVAWPQPGSLDYSFITRIAKEWIRNSIRLSSARKVFLQSWSLPSHEWPSLVRLRENMSELALRACTTTPLEWDEIPSLVIPPGTAPWILGAVTNSAYFTRRDYAAALFERVERGTPIDGSHPLARLRLAQRLNATVTDALRRYKERLPQVPFQHKASFEVNAARALRSKIESCVADWTRHMKAVAELNSQAHDEAIKRFISRCPRRTLDERGWYTDWCFTMMRNNEALRALCFDDFGQRIQEMKSIVEPLWSLQGIYEDIPQRAQVVNAPIIGGKAFEEIVVKALREQWTGSVLENVCVQGRAKVGEKQEIDAILVDEAGRKVVIVECKVNLRSALSDVDKMRALISTHNMESCEVLYVGAEDDMEDGLLLYGKGARNAYICELATLDMLQLHEDGRTYTLSDEFSRSTTTVDRVAADMLRAIDKLGGLFFRVLKVKERA